MIDSISNQHLFQAILYGASKTREKQDELNKINVFPVIDNDTGNNLAHTMHYILKHARKHDSIKDTLKDVARASLIGARGNSGAIFSQYFSGLSHNSSSESSITLSELADYFQEAYSKAYKAIEEPVEGTIITLMRAWSASFKESLQEQKSVNELFTAAMFQIQNTLKETTSTLKILKKMGVVDAGALGFYYFMDGFTEAIINRGSVTVIDPEKTAPIVDEDIHTFNENEIIEFRYCTEVLLEFAALDEKLLRQELKPLGDCLLISSSDELMRIHLHTNKPWEVIKICDRYGKILEQKADDMILQNFLAGKEKSDIACITDSIADLPQEYIFAHNIFQMPINIMINNINYYDKITVDGSFLSKYEASASTSQLNTRQILDFLRPIINKYKHILILTVSSQMSGTFSRFKAALPELENNHNTHIELIDTKVNSGAQGLLVRAAAEMIEKDLPFSQIVATIEEMKTRARIVVSVLDIGPMARSGRVSERIGRLLIKMKFKPLVTINKEGNGTIKGIAFSAHKNWQILLRSLRRKSIAEYAIVHADNPEKAAKIKAEMIKFTGKEPLFISEISSAVILFAGMGSTAVAYIENRE